MRKIKGFTLIELMVVISIIGILASMAMPVYYTYINQARVRASVSLVEDFKINSVEYYKKYQHFPKDNATLGIPVPNKILGVYVSKVVLEDGAFQIYFRKQKTATNQIAEKVISIRPIIVANSPKSPVSWICGNASVPSGMTAVGVNRTDVTLELLPIECRI